MRVSALLLAISLAAPAAGPAVADPISDFFRYEPRPMPVAGDCQALAAEIGANATWHGRYSGKRHDDFTENFHLFSARGCFESEFACRVWQGRLTNYSNGGPVITTQCRQGFRG